MKSNGHVGRIVSTESPATSRLAGTDLRNAAGRRRLVTAAAFLLASAAWWVLSPGTALAQAGASDSLTVQEAVRLAVTGHPAAARARQTLAAAEEHITGARSPYYPNVSFEGSYGRVSPVPSVTIPGRATIDIYPDNNYDVHLGLYQTIYDFGRTASSVELARAGRDAAEVGLEQVRSDLAYRTIAAFNAILILRSSVAVLDEQVLALTRHLEITRKRMEAGTATDFDALTTEVRIAAASNDRIDAANALEGQEIQFRGLTGLGNREPVLLKGEFTSTPVSLDPDSLRAEASSRRPEMMAARAAETSARIQARLFSLGKRPSMTANVTTGFKNGYSPELNEMKANLFAGVQADVPLFDGQRTRSQTREAEATLLAARAHTEDLERQVVAEVDAAIAGTEANLDKIQNADVQVTQAEKAVSMAQTRYEAGVATNLDVLDAQTALLQARLNRLRALYSYTVSLTALDRATGRRFW